jgi:hypothetical protein
MQGIALQSGWETFLLAAPLVGMVLVGVFRLDQIATNPKSHGHQPGPTRNDDSAQMLLSTPDKSHWPDTRGPVVTTRVN